MKAVFLFLLPTIVNAFVPIGKVTKALFYRMNIVSDKFSFYPKIQHENITEQQKYDLQWVVIDRDNVPVDIPRSVNVKGKEYTYLKKSSGFYNAMEKSTYSDENSNVRIEPVDIIRKNGWVYMNTYGYKNKRLSEGVNRDFMIEDTIVDTSNIRFFDTTSFLSADTLVANIVDIGHFTIQYLFGNVYDQQCLYYENVYDIDNCHSRMRKVYRVDSNTIASKLCNIDNITIQTDLYLKYTVSTTITMGEYYLTITGSCLPIGKNNTKLFLKTYHNLPETVTNRNSDKILRLTTTLLDIWSMAHTKNTELWNLLSIHKK